MVDKRIKLISKNDKINEKLFDEKNNNSKINKTKVFFIQNSKDNLNKVLLDSCNNETKDLEKKDKTLLKNYQKFNTLNENPCHYTKETSKESIFDKGKNDEEKNKEKNCDALFVEYNINYIKDLKKKYLNYFEKIYNEMLKEWNNKNTFHLFNKKLISYYFITFCFRKEFEIFINIWNNKDIINFFILQIYLFTSILLLKDNSFENKIMTRNYLNAFEYSFQNFQLLTYFNQADIIKEKDKLNFHTKNKIIKSIVDTFNYFISEKFNKIMDLLNFIKDNKNLSQIIKSIEEKSKLISKDD